MDNCICHAHVGEAGLPEGKGKVKVNVDLYSASSWNTSKALRYGARSQGISQFYLHTRVHPLTEWTIPAFAFPAEAGTHLPTPEGWKAELALACLNTAYHSRSPQITTDQS